MFKLVVLSALVAVAVAKPGLYHGAVKVVAPIIAKTYVAPAAVSSTYREDIISKPADVTYAAPAYAYASKAIVAEPVALAAPVVAKTVVSPAAVSHTYREDIISKPAALTYAAPVVHKTVVAGPVEYTAPATYTYAAHVPAAYAYAAHAPAVHAW